MMGQTVRQTMTRDVYAVSPATDLATAARLLVTRHIGGAPVIDSDGRAVGVVTLRDLADPDAPRSATPGESLFYHVTGRRTDAVGDSSDPVAEGSGVVADVMSPFILSISADASLREAARVMVADGVHRLLVVDHGRLVGIISSMDVLRALGTD
jgi:CBS domain-containing protein